jgi:hypothetical protein
MVLTISTFAPSFGWWVKRISGREDKDRKKSAGEQSSCNRFF